MIEMEFEAEHSRSTTWCSRVRRDWGTTLARLAGILPLIVISSGCRFQVPTVAEQQYLQEQGAFAGGEPSWVVSGTAAGRLGGGAGGLIPQSFGSAAGTNPKRAPVTSSRDAGSSAGGLLVPSQIREAKQAELAARSRIGGTADSSVSSLASAEASKTIDPRASSAIDSKLAGAASAPLNNTQRLDEAQFVDRRVGGAAKESPLARIDRLCPGLESEVVKALQVVELAARRQIYESLVVRCPNSSDLWAWLGRDYEAEGKLDRAGRCYEKSLRIDPSSTELRKSLTAIHSKSAATKPKKSAAEMLNK